MTCKKIFLLTLLLFAIPHISCGSTLSGKNDPAKRIQVKVVSLAGCTATPPTIDRITEIAEELGLQIDLERVIVRTDEEAVRHRHIGSPTVQVNGLDIDPAARKTTDFGIT